MLLYIDPGTGSMLFTVFIGIFSAFAYFIQLLIHNLKFGTGKGEALSESKIPIVIFSDHKRYWKIFEPICDEFEKRKQRIVYMTESEDDPGLCKEYEFIEGRYIGSGNRAYAILDMLNACIVLSTTPGLNVYQWRRSKNVDYYIHILHAPGGLTTYRMLGTDFYDCLFISEHNQELHIRELEKIRNLKAKELVYAGIPYMDEMAKRLQSTEKPEKDNTTVLLAPTWGESSILGIYGSDLIDELIKTGYKIIIRPHPQSFTSEKKMIEGLIEKYPETDLLKWNRDNDNFDVLNESDILISDFSGVTFEYAFVFDKPVIYNLGEFDMSPYDCWWTGKKPWTFDMMPRIGKELNRENIASIKTVIDDCINNEEYAVERNKARDEMWPFRGQSASLIADYIVNKLKEIDPAND